MTRATSGSGIRCSRSGTTDSRLGHVGSRKKPLHISQFFDRKASRNGCLGEYPGYGWGMFHFCIRQDGIALIQDEAVGGYKGRGTVSYAWAN